MEEKTKETARKIWGWWGNYNNFVDILDLLGWKTIGISMLSYMGAYAWLWEPGQRAITVLLGIVAAILVGVISIVWQLRQGQQVKPSPKESNTIVKKRPQWEAELPLSEIFKVGNDIHALFLTGEGIFTRHPDYVRHIKRLILPERSAQFFGLVEESRKKAGIILNCGEQVAHSIRTALEKGVGVRCLPDHIGVSLIVCDPEKPNAWMHIGFSTPFIDADNQPILRIKKEDSPELFSIFYQAYNRMWEQAIIQKL